MKNKSEKPKNIRSIPPDEGEAAYSGLSTEWAKKPDELSAWFPKTIRTYEKPQLHASLMDIDLSPFPSQDEWLNRIQMLIPKV